MTTVIEKDGCRCPGSSWRTPRRRASTPMLPVVVSGPPGAERGTLRLVLEGAGVLVLGFAALGSANFVLAQFERSAMLGWLTLAVALGGFGLIGWASGGSCAGCSRCARSTGYAWRSRRPTRPR